MKFPKLWSTRRRPSAPANLSLDQGSHSFKALGSGFYVQVPLRRLSGARLVLFNHPLADSLGLALSAPSADIEQWALDAFAWFKAGQNPDHAALNSAETRTFFATRYQDADDKGAGSALGDGRTVWAGEIPVTASGQPVRYVDLTIKGIGVTPLAWLNHPKPSHRDGLLGMTEAVHEYLYSLAAIGNGLDAVAPLAVIELPFMRPATGDRAALLVRAGNHLRFAHYRQFASQPQRLERLFEYGLKRDLGLPLTHAVSHQEVRDYLELIVNNLAHEAAVYYDLHAVHGAPTFGNRTSSGGSIDLATFVYLDAHHGEYRYMPGGAYRLGGAWGQREQLFVLFSDLVKRLRQSDFKHAATLAPERVYWGQFRDALEHHLTRRWLARLGLAENEIAALSTMVRRRFHRSVSALYEAQGTRKIKLNRGRTRMAAFEPRRVLAGTARHLERLDDLEFVWAELFRVERHWATLNLAQAQPYISDYAEAVKSIVAELDDTGAIVKVWQNRTLRQRQRLAERRAGGADFFYDSERFLCAKPILELIQNGQTGWPEISRVAAEAAEHRVDQGLPRLRPTR